MALIYKDNVLRNLQEQVEKNKDDILYILEEEGILNEFGIRVVGNAETIDGLPDPLTYEGEFGDAYVIGTEAPYTFYIFTRAGGTHINNYWFDLGEFPKTGPQGEQGLVGPVGPQGPKGDTGTPGTDGVTIVSSNTMYSSSTSGQIVPTGPWTLEIPDFVQGQFVWCRTTVNYSDGRSTRTYAISYVPRNGTQGPQGEPGKSAESFTIIGKLDNVNQLPTPTEDIRFNAYLIPTESGSTYELYIIVGTEGNLSWTSTGLVDEIPGPRGPAGYSVYLYDGTIASGTQSIDPTQIALPSSREPQAGDILISTYETTFGAMASLRYINSNGRWIIDYVGQYPSELSSTGSTALSASSFSYDSLTGLYRAIVSIPERLDDGQSVFIAPEDITAAQALEDWKVFYGSFRATKQVNLYAKEYPVGVSNVSVGIKYTILDTQNDSGASVYIQNIAFPEEFKVFYGYGSQVITPDQWFETTSSNGDTVYRGQIGTSFSFYRGGTNIVTPATEADALTMKEAGAYWMDETSYIYVKKKPTVDFKYCVTSIPGESVGLSYPQAVNILETGYSPVVDGLPTVTAEDAGKFLRVDSTGVWTAETIPQAEGESV